MSDCPCYIDPRTNRARKKKEFSKGQGMPAHLAKWHAEHPHPTKGKKRKEDGEYAPVTKRKSRATGGGSKKRQRTDVSP